MDNYEITFDTWNKVGDIYQEKFMDLDLYDDTYDTFCRLIKKPNARIFEIGTGPGNITRYLLSKRPDFRINGIDVAPKMIELARKNNPTADFQVVDCRKLDGITTKYDAVMCGFCMPYLSREDCAELIQDCTRLLERGGILYFSTIEGDYSSSGFEVGGSGNPAYVYYHQEDYLRKLLQENGFELVDFSRKYYQNAAEASPIHMIFIVRKI